MLSCQQITELVTDYLEGRMGFVERVRFQMHVGMCKHCRAYLRQLKATVGALGKMPETPMPEPIRDELRARFADWHARARKKSPGSP